MSKKALTISFEIPAPPEDIGERPDENALKRGADEQGWSQWKRVDTAWSKVPGFTEFVNATAAGLRQAAMAYVEAGGVLPDIAPAGERFEECEVFVENEKGEREPRKAYRRIEVPASEKYSILARNIRRAANRAASS